MSARLELTASGKLPDGRVVVMRELNTADELRAAADADRHAKAGPTTVGAFQQISSIKRALVSIDGVEFDQGLTELQTFRDSWTKTEWVCLMELFQHLHAVEEEAIATFRDSISTGA